MEKIVYRVVLIDRYNGFAYNKAINKFIATIEDAVKAADDYAANKASNIGGLKVTMPSQAKYITFVMVDGIDQYSASVWPVVFDSDTGCVSYRDTKICADGNELSVSFADIELARCVDINDALMFVDAFVLGITFQRMLAEGTK